MGNPVIKIFPNSKSDEFATYDELSTWLMTSFKARNGEYLLPHIRAIADLPSGSIVLFRFGLQAIVGEAVVIRTETNAETNPDWPASVWFAPSSIRLFVPAISIATLQKIIGGPKVKDITQMANAYAKFDDWKIYPQLLSVHLKGGGHFL